MKRRAALTTLGCRLNQSETHLLSDRLEAAGYTVVRWGEPADLAVINTCTVTRLAEAKARQVIRKFIRENPKAFVAVVGCYSQMGAREIAAIPGVDLIIGNQEKLRLLEYLGDGTKLPQPVIVREKIDPADFSLQWAGETPFAQRANLKIQDGCDFACSFCIIPKARGRARARDFADLLREARSQVARGVRELVLTGVNLGTYEDREGRTLLDVVDALEAIEGLDRLRVSSIEPTTVEHGLLERMASPEHALLPFLHL
ncbi:MAG: radical SAM protein, partial [Opitutales bacterium]